MSYKYTNKLWAITDLIKMIGQYKYEFEHISDIEKLNAAPLFQHIIAIIFNCNSDNGVIKYDNRTGGRLSMIFGDDLGQDIVCWHSSKHTIHLNFSFSFIPILFFEHTQSS